MAINRSPLMTVEDYLEWELKQERKHEYIDGVIYEMPGVSDTHDAITVNIIYLFMSCLDRLRFHLRNRRNARASQSEPLCIPRSHHCPRTPRLC